MESGQNTDKWISENEEIWHTMYDENIANKVLTNRQLETKIMNRLDILNSSFIWTKNYESLGCNAILWNPNTNPNTSTNSSGKLDLFSD